jgi:hypothetical protein
MQGAIQGSIAYETSTGRMTLIIVSFDGHRETPRPNTLVLQFAAHLLK